MATQHSGPPRVPLIASLSQRGETLTLDTRLINGYVEKMENGEVWAIKRPGINVFRSFGSTGGLGTYYTIFGLISIVISGAMYVDGTNIGTVDTTGGFYYFSMSGGASPTLFLHNSSHAYYYTGSGAPVAIAALTNTYTLAAGAAYLDGTMYVGALPNTLFGSNINDLTTWNAANAIQAQMYPDAIQYVFRQLNYVVVVKQGTTEAFFDAGNATGSPLQSAPNAFVPFGNRTARTLQLNEDTAFWVNGGGTTGITVFMLENMKPQIISTPPVERFLQQSTFNTVYSFSFRLDGHRFYGLTLKDMNTTLVYDASTEEWYHWTDWQGNYLPFVASTFTANGQPIFQDEQGNIQEMEGTFYIDNGGNYYPFDLYTPNWDGGSRIRKYLHRTDFITDQNYAGKLYVRVSDDDYQTWSNFREVDLSKKRPSLFNCGTFHKRAWHLRYIANTPLRLQAIELSLQPGSV